MPAPMHDRVTEDDPRYRITKEIIVMRVHSTIERVGLNLSLVIPAMGLKKISQMLAADTIRPPATSPRPTTSAYVGNT